MSEVAERAGLTSDTAKARIGRAVNERYRYLASTLGFATISRGDVTATTVIGDQSLSFGPTPTKVEKLFAIYDLVNQPDEPLDEATLSELRARVAPTGAPQSWAVQLMGASSVVVYLNAIPDAPYVLTADALLNTTTLSDNSIPAFAEDFHLMLVYGPLATELRKQEKYDLARECDNMAKEMLGELRLFIARSAYRDFYQGKTARG